MTEKISLKEFPELFDVRESRDGRDSLGCCCPVCVPVGGEDVEVTEKFTSLGSDIHVSICCEPEFNGNLGLA